MALTHLLQFRNFPDFKGIKTEVKTIHIPTQFGLETSLTSKGLRHRVFALFTLNNV